MMRPIRNSAVAKNRVPRQPDLFGHNGQHELFGEDAPTLGRADPDAVRQELYKILAEARAAQTMPLGP